ncbi:MAG: hypothetical protein WAQ72_07130, partial [Dethiobacteria bacterium]
GLPHRQAGPLKEKINIPYLPLETANPWKEKVIFSKLTPYREAPFSPWENSFSKNSQFKSDPIDQAS